MALESTLENGNLYIKKVTYIGLFANFGLAILKIFVGLMGRSMSLVADGIHSFSDMVTDITVLLGIHFGTQKPDRSHPYGHGRIETFSTALISIILIVVGLIMVYKAGADIATAEIAQPSLWAVAAALISIGIKEWLFRITKKIAVNTHSSSLYANAWHHRSDALSSVAVVVGLISMMAGFKYGDRIAAIAVGLLITYVGWSIFEDCLNEFAERSADEETVQQIRDIVNSNEDIHNWHRLRTRTVGREIFLDLHILVDPDLNIRDAHQISENLESALHRKLKKPANIIIHVEPDLPEQRKESQ